MFCIYCSIFQTGLLKYFTETKYKYCQCSTLLLRKLSDNIKMLSDNLNKRAPILFKSGCACNCQNISIPCKNHSLLLKKCLLLLTFFIIHSSNFNFEKIRMAMLSGLPSFVTLYDVYVPSSSPLAISCWKLPSYITSLK